MEFEILQLKINIVKKHFIPAALFIMLFILSGCEVVGGIFKAGMWWGIFLVVAVIGGIIYLITRGRK
jgi:hypothetical protein